MAVCDFIPVEKIPVLVVPEIGVEECEGELGFRVENQFGVVRIAGYGWGANCKWKCRGSAEALAAAGLLELTWLPGLPGNAKISQRVIFNGKPEPYRGPRTSRQFANSICVVRLGKNYEVEIPATPEQAVVLDDVRERYMQARERQWPNKIVIEPIVFERAAELSARAQAMPTASCANPTRYEEATIRRALRILEKRLRQPGEALTSSDAVRDYLRLLLRGKEHEVFCCVFLDAQHRVTAVEELFRGTLTQISVYPREVVKRALHHNAAALVLAHNHPSGATEPSQADHRLTHRLAEALALVDVRVLDHFIVAGPSALSFREAGFLDFYAQAAPPPKPKPQRGRKAANA